MKIVEYYEARRKVGGDFQIFVKIIAWHDGEMYVGKWRDRQQAPTTFEQLEEVKIIPTKDRGPDVRPDWKVASSGSRGWVKQPSWEDFLSPQLEAHMEHEIEMCELLQQSPHVNVAAYRGCLLGNGRVKGLLFDKYQQTLLEKVNPQRLSKVHFVQGDRRLVDETVWDWLPQLRSAVSHLHKLGYVHNDISPANIMIGDDEKPVLIDFEGMCRVGESLQKVKRTIGWHDETVMLARESNDWDALDEIETWLFGKVDNLKFVG
ncbi:hypothetical protein LLEC1_02082 [Akanthomyces lecanii]|uniref:EKC/KEOPS complex subunit BUD32 n=1 Tax=Cordyceps confragosa TaxID=2714763 RepID=A0A179I6K0_CORDF|nr:hypothetical protein LLEC1_02082 [Akanthomyces lecanii]